MIFACLFLVYLFIGALFLFWSSLGNLAGAVKGGRSARVGERVGERFGGRGRRIGAFKVTVIVVSL